jgi:hypothetical protein
MDGVTGTDIIGTDERREIVNGEHLRILGIAYYVSAAFTAFFSLFALFYVGMGFVFVVIARQESAGADAPPEAMGLVMALIGGLIFLMMATITGLKFYVGRCLQRRRQRILCLIVAAVGCLEIPYGTALGVLTFIVLARPEVKRQFDALPETATS